MSRSGTRLVEENGGRRAGSEDALDPGRQFDAPTGRIGENAIPGHRWERPDRQEKSYGGGGKQPRILTNARGIGSNIAPHDETGWQHLVFCSIPAILLGLG